MKILVLMLSFALCIARGQTDSMFVIRSDGSSVNYGLNDINSITFSGAVTSIEDQENVGSILSSFALYQNFPNPFNPSTTIKYDLPLEGNVTVSVYDIQGRLVRSLGNGPQQAGTYAIVWNGRRDDEATAASGAYFYRVEFNNTVLVRKLLLIK